MKNWRFAFNRRWLTYLGMAVVFSVACVLLSQWQFGRNQQTQAESKLVTRNYNAAPVPVADLLRTMTSYSPSTIWRTVSVEGVYETSKQVLVRDRSLGSNPGFEVLTPLRLTDGSIFIVDRGWVPVGTSHDYPDYVPPAPTGAVRVTARLQGSETILPGRTAPAGEVSEINLPTVARGLGGPTYTGAYGLLAAESPAPPSRPIAAARPVIDPGPFLSYAFQWILFALFAFSGLGWALRQEYRIRNAADPLEKERAVERERKARRRAPTDADVEDTQIREAQDRGAQPEAEHSDRERVGTR
jgi:cytochrome oxidase assembly protein ShyY1